MHRLVFTVFLSLAAASTVQAREWTVPDLLSAATAAHPLVAGKRSEAAAAAAEHEAARWQRWPALTAEYTTRDAVEEQEAGAAEPYGTGTLRLEQPLWMGGRINGSIAAAHGRKAAADEAVAEMRHELRLRVLAAASEALRQQQRSRVAATQVRNLDELLEMIRRRVDQQVSADSDLKLAQSRRLAGVSELNAIEQARQAALVQLTQLAGATVTAVRASVPAVPAGPDMASAPLDSIEAALPATLAELQDRALAWSPRLKRLRFETEAAEAALRVRKSSFSPALSLRLESVHRDGRNLAGPDTDNRAYLVLQAQPGAGLSVMAGVDAAAASLRAAQEAEEAARREVGEQVQLVHAQWQAARARLVLARGIHTSAAEVADSYARLYNAGRKSWLEVLNAVREAMQAELSSVDALHESLLAAWRLHAMIGGWD